MAEYFDISTFNSFEELEKSKDALLLNLKQKYEDDRATANAKLDGAIITEQTYTEKDFKVETAALKADYNATVKKVKKEYREILHARFPKEEKAVRKQNFKDAFRFLTNGKTRYFLKRLLSSVITLILVVVLIKCLIACLPDTKFYNIQEYNRLKNKSGLETANAWRNAELMKVNRVHADGTRVSLFEQIGTFLWHICPIPKRIAVSWYSDGSVKDYWTGLIYLGRSTRYSNTEVSALLGERMGLSFTISILSMIITYIFAFPLGVAMAKKPGGLVDKIGTAFIVLNYAIPALVFYLFMRVIMGKKDGIFGWAEFGMLYDSANPSFKQLLPAIICMSFLSIPGVIIWLRRYMVDELNSDYVKFARSKGLSENRIMYTHVLKNAFVPLVRSIPGTFIGAIVGSYFVEKIWAIPGTGFLLTDSLQISKFDLPVVESLTFIYAGLSMLVFLLGDLVTVIYDPRIKLTD